MPQVALLTTLPPLLGALTQLLSGWAGRYFGHRTRLTTMTSFVARAVSVYHLRFLTEPASTASVPDLHIRVWLTDLRASGALTFSTYFMLMNFGVAIASPLLAVYMLRDLEFSYLQFCLSSVRYERHRTVPDPEHLGAIG